MDYHFILQVFDNHAHLHKDHQVKPALEMNQVTNRPLPIIWISGRYRDTIWFGVWCRDTTLVRKLTHLFTGTDFVRNWVNAVANGEVRGACNGGFFDFRTGALIGHVGTGSRWHGQDIGSRTQLNRWCFGMEEIGTDLLTLSMVETRTERGF